MPVPFQLTETDVDIPSEDEDNLSKNINSINVSSIGKLKFNKLSQSNVSTFHESHLLSNYKSNSRDSKDILITRLVSNGVDLARFGRYDHSELF